MQYATYFDLPLLPFLYYTQGETVPYTSVASASVEPEIIQTCEMGIQTDPLPVQESIECYPIEQTSPPLLLPAAFPIHEPFNSEVEREVEASSHTQFEESPSTPHRLVNLSRSVVAQHDIESVSVPRASRSPSPIVEVDYVPAVSRDPTTGGPVVVREDDRSLEELAEIKQRYQDLANQYGLLEQRYTFG